MLLVVSIFVFLFFVNFSRKGTNLFVSEFAHDSSLLPRSFRQTSCSRNVTYPSIVWGHFHKPRFHVLWHWQVSEIKLPCISEVMSTHLLNLVAITETHIHPTDNDSLLYPITPTWFILCHRPYLWPWQWDWLFVN